MWLTGYDVAAPLSQASEAGRDAARELRRAAASDAQLLGALGAVMLEAAPEGGKASAYAAMALRQVTPPPPPPASSVPRLDTYPAPQLFAQ